MYWRCFCLMCLVILPYVLKVCVCFLRSRLDLPTQMKQYNSHWSSNTERIAACSFSSCWEREGLDPHSLLGLRKSPAFSVLIQPGSCCCFLWVMQHMSPSSNKQYAVIASIALVCLSISSSNVSYGRVRRASIKCFWDRGTSSDCSKEWFTVLESFTLDSWCWTSSISCSWSYLSWSSASKASQALWCTLANLQLSFW